MENRIELVKLENNRRQSADKLTGIFRTADGGGEKFLFISPHDDDAVLGGGLLMQLARRENIPVYLIIVSDGSMGYGNPEQKETISKIRQRETYKCYEKLGFPKENIIWLGLPDCRLDACSGRRPAEENDPSAIQGFAGLQNIFTYHLRRIRPTHCFLPTSSDIHPDHKTAHREFMISLFHSTGEIWLELGKPLEDIPDVFEMAVYCDFPSVPTVRIKTSESFLKQKMDAIAAFESQKQIKTLVDKVGESGPYEYLRNYNFKLYDSSAYYEMFEEKR